MNSAPRSRTWSFRVHLGVLLSGTLLPVLLFAGWVIRELSSEMQSNVERRLLLATRAMNSVFEDEVNDSVDALTGLSTARSLGRDDFETFRVDASRVLRSHPAWSTVIVSGPDGTTLLDLEQPVDETLSAASAGSGFVRAVEQRRSTLGPLRNTGRAHPWRFPIHVPVLRDGEVRYVLTAQLTPTAMLRELSRNIEKDQLTRTLVDDAGTVVLRDRNPEKFIGQRATANFLEKTRRGTEGVFPSITLEGIPSYVAYFRSPRGWTSSVVVPRSVIEGSPWRSAGALAACGLLALVVSAAGAGFVSRRIRRALIQVEDAAAALARGETVPEVSTRIEELARLNASLAASAALLRDHSRERDAHLADLEAAVRARDEFLSLASHELKTPLTALALHARILERTQGGDGSAEGEPVARFLGQLDKQVGRLKRLIDDMLDISRINAGKLTLERERFDLGEFVEDAAERLRPVLAAAGCTLSVTTEETILGEWDRFRIEQVLDNLLTNAARYAAGSPVRIVVRRRGEAAEVSVLDQGPGLSKENAARVFEKFERFVPAGEAPGLGLGLYIAREIVQMHGGEIHVESDPGAGARFVFTLPCGVEAPSALSA